MVFACQRDSYLKEYESKIISCESSVLKVNKNESVKGYDVILEDTILFPEGGGQPHDCGTINGEHVLRVWRKGTNAIHFLKTDKSFTIGDNVHIKVNWDRRWDHMQQHTAQHLISAIAEDMFQMPTTSWTLGISVSSIEMDTPQIDEKTIIQLETILNEKIRESIPIRVMMYDKDDDALNSVRTRLELPEDQSGPIRVVNIEGIDSNTCCGTHVANLNHLQMIKLLHTEKGKKNKTEIFFVAGDRVLRYLDTCVKRDRTLTSLLKCSPDTFVTMIDKLQKSLKLSQKNCLNAVRDLAQHEANKFLDLKQKPKYYSIHRKESETDFITTFIREVKDAAKDTLLLISVTDDSTNPNSGGQIAMFGDVKLIEKFSSRVSQMLEGKGILKDGKFQAKVSNLSKRSKVDDMINANINES